MSIAEDGGGLENDPQLKYVFPSIVIDVENEKSTVLRTRWAEVDSRSPGKHGRHGANHILVSKPPVKLSPGPWSEKPAGLTRPVRETLPPVSSIASTREVIASANNNTKVRTSTDLENIFCFSFFEVQTRSAGEACGCRR